jgi:leader peptidase (prepilin peptidase)/N-methyltransferase
VASASAHPGARNADVESARLRPLRSPVALTAAACAALAFARYPLGAGAAIAAFLAAVLVILAAIDIRSGRIPNRIVLPATAIVLVADLVFWPGHVGEFVLAALVTSGVLLIPNLISSSWMGMGDVKLGLLLGVALGWGAIGALMIAFIAVLPVALVIMARGGASARKATLPFGPFMAFGALAVLIVPWLAGLGG